MQDKREKNKILLKNGCHVKSKNPQANKNFFISPKKFKECHVYLNTTHSQMILFRIKKELIQYSTTAYSYYYILQQLIIYQI